MRIKNLLNGKLEGGFLGLAADLLSFSMALAVFAAGVMLPEGCDNLTDVGNSYDEAVSEEAASSVPKDASGSEIAADYV